MPRRGFRRPSRAEEFFGTLSLLPGLKPWATNGRPYRAKRTPSGTVSVGHARLASLPERSGVPFELAQEAVRTLVPGFIARPTVVVEGILHLWHRQERRDAG